jgi:hypothetical protein
VKFCKCHRTAGRERFSAAIDRQSDNGGFDFLKSQMCPMRSRFDCAASLTPAFAWHSDSKSRGSIQSGAAGQSNKNEGWSRDISTRVAAEMDRAKALACRPFQRLNLPELKHQGRYAMIGDYRMANSLKSSKNFTGFDNPAHCWLFRTDIAATCRNNPLPRLFSAAKL